MTLSALLFAVLSGALAAQTFREGISVTVVEVPVTVLSDGRPVRGLTREDFEILDRGEPREITGFNVIDLTNRRRDSVAVGPRPGASPAPPTAATRGRHILILFDLQFSERFHLYRCLEGARELVREQLHSRDRVAVATYSGNGGLSILTGFTGDRRTLGLAVDVVEAAIGTRSRLIAKRIAALQDRMIETADEAGDTRFAIQSLSSHLGPAAFANLTGATISLGPGAFASALIETSPSGRFASDDPSSDPTLQQLAEQPNPEMERGLHAVGLLARRLGDFVTLWRDVPDPKHLLYLSQGFATAFIRDPNLRPRALNRLQPMLEAFRNSGWILQAVDLEGVPRTGMSAELSPEQTAQLSLIRLPETVGFDAEALFYLANETGGTVMENYNRLEVATEKLIERTAVTYVLAFLAPDPPETDRYHRLEVRLKDRPRGFQITHRPGYHTSKKPGKRTDAELRMDAVERILGDSERDDLGISVRVLERPVESRTALVPLAIEIPGSSVLAENRKNARLEINAYALDAHDGIHDLLIQALDLDLEKLEEALNRGGIRFLGALELPAGEQRIRVQVRDLEAIRESLTTTPVSLENRDGDDLFALFLAEPDGWIEVRGRRERSEGSPTVPPDLAGSWPRHVSRPELRPGLATEVLVLSGEDRAPRWRILEPDGSEVAGGRLEWRARDATGAFTGDFAPTDLAPGDYLLELSAARAETDVARLAFSIPRVRP